jgi:Protein of unknown function (DUF1648)
MRIAGYVVLAVTIVAALLQLIYMRQYLPESVASHFGSGGKPDGFMDRDSFLMLMALLQIGLPLFMVAIGKGIRYMPNDLINVPNRQFWLSPPHREFTLGYMEALLVWISAMTGVFMIGINYLTYRANIDKAALDEFSFVTMLVAFLVTITGICGFIFRRFRLPK